MESLTTFEETGLNPELLKAIAELGYKHPTPIQEKAIPALLDTDRDFLGLAQTGTGKTAAFGLPLIQLIDTSIRSVQAIVLCPTRELARQITSDLESFAKYIGKLDVVSVYGGAAIQTQISAIRQGAQVVVGTPGRVIDLIQRRVLKLDGIKYLILDEADEMLNMGFKEDLDIILAETPEEKQTFLFSATMPKEVARIADRYMNDPIEMSAGEKNVTAVNISHQMYQVARRDRYPALKRIADFNPDIYGIVFCRTRKETQDVADKLIQDGYNADSLHGDLSQAQRDHVMARFRNKNLQILVATDVAARGIDVSDISHVINYNLPDDPEVYVHRSGRTARAGKLGIALSLVTPDEQRKIKMIDKQIGRKMEIMQIPEGGDICQKQMIHFAEQLKSVHIDDREIEPFIDAIEELWADLDRTQLIKTILTAEFKRFLAYYKGNDSLNDRAISEHERRGRGRDGGDRDSRRGDRRDRDSDRGGRRDRRDRPERTERSPSSDRSDRTARPERRDRPDRSDRGDRGRDRAEDRARFDRYFISLGSKDHLNAQRLMGLINEHPGLDGVQIGRIEIQRKFSFFEIDKNFSKQTIGINGSEFRGQKVLVEPAENTHAPGRDTGGVKEHKKKKRKADERDSREKASRDRPSKKSRKRSDS
jgi:ATP-dependent RNA helicase DeaD